MHIVVYLIGFVMTALLLLYLKLLLKGDEK